MAAHTHLGRLGEDVAVRHLEDAGMAVVARNWRCAEHDLRGELDVVAWEDGVLVVCEVKTRRGHDSGGPLLAVTHAKYRQLRRLAGAYLVETGLTAVEVRFDLVGVTVPESDEGCPGDGDRRPAGEGLVEDGDRRPAGEGLVGDGDRRAAGEGLVGDGDRRAAGGGGTAADLRGAQVEHLRGVC